MVSLFCFVFGSIFSHIPLYIIKCRIRPKASKSAMGLLVFPDVSSGGLFPMLLINIAMSIALIKHLFFSSFQSVGFIQRSRISNAANNAAFGVSDMSFAFVDEYICSGMTTMEGCLDEIRKNLPLFVYAPNVSESAPNLAGDDTVCAVCLCEFERGHEIRLLPHCKHMFHSACLDQWLEHHHITCPLCRTSLSPSSSQVLLT